MVNVKSVHSLLDKKSIFESFEAQTQTWLVSDLKTKFEIQKILLQKQKTLPENSVLRASELWQKMLRQLRPEIKVHSTDFVKTYLTEYLAQTNIAWAQTPGASTTLLNYLNQLLPILLQPEGEEILKSWFATQKNALVKWGHWFELSKMTWQHICEVGICQPAWVPALLLQEDLTQLLRTYDLKIDLSSQFTLIEAELVKCISESGHSVEVLYPSATWVSNYKDINLPYQFLKNESLVLEPQVLTPLKGDHKTYLKYASEVSEIKSCISKVRQLLDQGIELNQIAIVAADIENLWPTLQPYLKTEGIPVNKSVVTRLSTFPNITSWLSHLKLLGGDIKSSYVESDLYSSEDQPIIKIDEFKRFYTHLFSHSDLLREHEINFEYETEITSSTSLSKSEFLSEIIKKWRSHWKIEQLEVLLARFIADTPSHISLIYKNWLQYLELIVSKVEVLISPADSKGIHCEKINALEWMNVKYVFVLSLTESNLTQSKDQGVSHAEVASLFQQTGFNLPSSTSKQSEFELLWNLSKEDVQYFLSYSNSDLSGQVQAPSKLWLVGSLMTQQWQEDVHAVEFSRWDELQQLESKEWARIYNWSKSEEDSFNKSLNRDFGNLYTHASKQLMSLSVSQVEKYLSCPFKVKAQKFYGLSDLPAVDLDVDRMTTGQLMHALFEELVQEPMIYDYPDEALEKIIEDCKEKENIILADKESWSHIKANYLKLAKKFLKAEHKWREEYPDTKTVAKELAIKTFWSTELGQFDSSGEFKFTGYVDRVDHDGDSTYSVIDYKSSAGQAKNHGSWLKNHNLQLAVYSAAIENGKTSLESGDVQGAYYYVSKNMNRGKGFTLKDSNDKFLPAKVSSTNALTSEKKQKLFLDVLEVFNEVAKKIKLGELEPKPEKYETCGGCSWNKICRGQHLNR